MGTHTTDVPLFSRTWSCSDWEGIKIQMTEMPDNTQGAEQRRDKVYMQATKNHTNASPFPDPP